MLLRLRAFNTPRWAYPLAPPPLKAKLTNGLRINHKPPISVSHLPALAFMILRDQEIETASRVSRLIKTGMAVTFMAFAAGSRTLTGILMG